MQYTFISMNFTAETQKVRKPARSKGVCGMFRRERLSKIRQTVFVPYKYVLFTNALTSCRLLHSGASFGIYRLDPNTVFVDPYTFIFRE